jgi:hypothetical protein
VLLALLLAVLVAAPRLAAQDTLAAVALDSLIELPMPPQLAETETARTTRCVPLINRVDQLNADLLPLRERTARLGRLVEAIALEDSTRAAPFAAGDPVEAAVRDWFASDLALARQFLASGDTTIQARRSQGREEILERVRAAGQATAEEAEAKIAATGDLPAQAQDCLGIMLVRPAVIAACAGVRSDLCTAAADTAPNPNSRFRFVPTAEDIWGVETLRPWTQPTRLGVTVQGTLSGASTNATVARGNVALVMGLEPIMQDRTTLPPEDLSRLQAALDSLGYSFQHPQFILVPGLAIRLIVGPALGGESYYFLHFGDLSNPAEDVIWSASAASGAPLSYMAPVRKPVLDRLAAGEPVTLTAVRFPQAGSMEGEAVYVLELPNVGQAAATQTLEEYLASGQMQSDFDTLAPTQPTAPPSPPAPGNE